MESDYQRYPHAWPSRLIGRFIQFLSILFLYWASTQWPPLQDHFVGGLQGQAVDWPAFANTFFMVAWPVFVAIVLLLFPQWWLSTESVREGLRRNPDKPWLARSDWARKHIVLSNRVGWRVGGVLFLALLLIAWPFAIGKATNVSYGIAIAATVLWLLVVRMFWMGRKWNTAELKMADVPGIIGGPLSGVVILHDFFPEGTVYAITLRCTKSKQRRTRKNGQTKTQSYTETIWSETLHLSQTLQAPRLGTTAVPFSFAIPYSCVQTDFVSQQPVYWELSASTKDGLPGMQSSFIVPVFRTSESQLHYQPDDSLVEPFIDRVDPEQVVARYHMRETISADGEVRWTFSHWRQSYFLGLLLFSAMCLGPVVWILLAIRPWNTALFVAVFPGVFLAMGLYGLYDLCTWRCHLRFIPQPRPQNQDKRKLAALQGRPHYQIQFESGVFGFRSRGTCPSSDECQIGSHQVVHNTAGERWDVVLTIRGQSKRVIMLSVLSSRRESDAVADFLAAKLQLSKRKGHTTEIVSSR